jgi:chromosome segregation ATPase
MGSGIIARNATLWRRVARVSGLIGVGVVFVANFLNDHAVADLQYDTQNVDVVQGDAAQARQASSTGLDQLQAADRISRLEVNLANVTSRSRADEVQSIVESYGLYFQTLESSVGMLGDGIAAVNEIPERGVALTEQTTETVASINEEVAAIRATITANRERLDQLRSRHQAAESEEEAERITAEMDQILEEFGTLEAEYMAIAEDVTGVFDEVEEQVAAELQASQDRSDALEALVYLLSGIGAAIAGFGSWLGGKLGVSDDLSPTARETVASA